jgi:hypothetical protein
MLLGAIENQASEIARKICFRKITYKNKLETPTAKTANIVEAIVTPIV